MKISLAKPLTKAQKIKIAKLLDKKIAEAERLKKVSDNLHRQYEEGSYQRTNLDEQYCYFWGNEVALRDVRRKLCGDAIPNQAERCER